MTDLTTKTAQSLHAEWCRQMREKGMHGPRDKCPENPSGILIRYRTNSTANNCVCRKQRLILLPWPDLPESRRQEYLATAKAVLPEIVGEVFDECQMVAQDYEILEVDKIDLKYGTGHCPIAIRERRDRRLEELK